MHMKVIFQTREGSKHMLARRSLGAHSVLGVFEGARVLKSEHMLGSLVLGLDAQRVLGDWEGGGGKPLLKAEKKLKLQS